MAYLEISSDVSNEIVINKSRFIGYLCNTETEEAALLRLENIRRQHRDATHHCFAYMIGPERGIMRYSDDGEPQGTAGVPILEVLKQAGLTNVLMVCVRYFGGILLGAGGLVRAYSGSTADAVKKAQLVLPEIMDEYALTVTYAVWAKLEAYLRQHNIAVSNVTYEDNVKATFVCEKGSDAAQKAAAELSSGNAGCVFTRETVVKKPV